MPDSRDPRRWIEYAENDFQAGSQIKDSIASSAAFLFHASSEKYLKAVLLQNQIPALHTHDISILLQTVEPNLEVNSREQQAAKLLDIVFNISRYPDDLLEMGLEETNSVYEATLVLRTYAREKLGLEEAV
jgi:HEPN domain-containing protein